MAELLNRLFHICLLTKGPQDLPYSILLFRVFLLTYFLTGLASLATSFPIEDAVLLMVVDISLLLLFSWLCLMAFKMQARFVQMITALAGIGSLFNLLAIPLMAQIEVSKQGGQIAGELSFLLLFLISWNLAVIAHVFRESFDVRLLAAFVLTLAYKVIEVSLSQILFPQLGA